MSYFVSCLVALAGAFIAADYAQNLNGDGGYIVGLFTAMFVQMVLKIGKVLK